ncbi:methyltransferase domain-containing protein, partial [Kaarinaea lacus]
GVVNTAPAQVLLDFQHLLPPLTEPVAPSQQVMALDLACGLGANALYLAQQGFTVHAWDISSVAIEKLQQAAARQQLNIQAQIRDIEEHPPDPCGFDVIVVSRYLQRSIIPQIVSALKSKGLLFYQTFIKAKNPQVGPTNAEFLLNNNELLSLFKDLTILAYREEGLVGDLSRGFRDEAMLVAQKPY